MASFVLTGRRDMRMLDRGVDGFLYAATYTRQARPPAVLRRHPVVMLNCLTEDPRTPAVVPDELAAGRTAARVLLEAGHTEHIYLIGETPPEAYADAQRPAGIRERLNDRVAFGAYQALQEAGMDIPADVSVISFDDSDLASWLRPQLSSIAIPHFELGRRAVELLLAEHRDGGVERVRMPLRDRASVTAPAARRGGTRPGRARAARRRTTAGA